MYRNITVEGKEYRYDIGRSITIRDDKQSITLHPRDEFPDLKIYDIERAEWKGYWYGFHPHHIEKLIRKHFLGQSVDMAYFDFPTPTKPNLYRPPSITEILHNKHENQNPIGAIFVGGDFNDNGGRVSGYIRKLAPLIGEGLGFEGFSIFNGGSFIELSGLIARIEIEKPAVIFWFANVPNDKEKVVDQIKATSPSSILVCSKDNTGDRYTFPEIISRMLKIKANLSVIFHKGQVIHASLADPLGNVFLDNEKDIEKVASAIVSRVKELLSMTRIKSVRVGDAIAAPEDEESLQFIEIIKRHAQEFARLTPTVSTERMLGNASFRCTHGFPSMKRDNLIFVSRRNIDKVTIGLDGFVAVNSLLEQEGIQYYGDFKPSVDTPIQALLYDLYHDVRYMIHGHVRIKDAPETSMVVPCGAVEEFREILLHFPHESSNFSVNLKGHGCIILAKDLDYFDTVTYIGRSIRTQI